MRVPRNGTRSFMKLQVRLRGEVLENWAFAFAEITHGPSTNFIGFRGPVGGDLGDSTRGPRQVDGVTQEGSWVFSWRKRIGIVGPPL